MCGYVFNTAKVCIDNMDFLKSVHIHDDLRCMDGWIDR